MLMSIGFGPDIPEDEMDDPPVQPPPNQWKDPPKLVDDKQLLPLTDWETAMA